MKISTKQLEDLNRIGDISAWCGLIVGITLVASLYVNPMKHWVSPLVCILLIVSSPFLLFTKGIVPLLMANKNELTATLSFEANLSNTVEPRLENIFSKMIRLLLLLLKKIKSHLIHELALIHIFLGVMGLILGSTLLLVWSFHELK